MVEVAIYFGLLYASSFMEKRESDDEENGRSNQKNLENGVKV